MPNKNIPIAYEKLLATLTRVQNDLDKRLPKLNEVEFLEAFGTEFQAQLSELGKNEFTRFKQTILNSIKDKFDGAKDTRKKIYNETIDEFLTKFDLNEALHSAQGKLNKNKQNLLKDLNTVLIENSQNLTADDRNIIQDAFTKKLNEDHDKLIKHLGGWKSLLPSTFAKIQLHLEAAQAENREKKNNDFTIDQLPELEKLKTPVKPGPTFGFKVNKKNLAEQIQSDIAAGKDIDINITIPDLSAIFKRIADTGFQHQKPALALVYMLIFLISMYIYNNEKRAIQSLKDVIKEKQLFDLDPSKITLQMTTPTPNGNERIIRKKGPLNPEQIKDLQLMIDENKGELQKYHQSIQTDKKLGLTTTESGYNTEEEEIPHSRPSP